SYAKILTNLLETSVITLPPLRPYDPLKPKPKGFDDTKICAYHRVPGHDVENCKALKTILIQLCPPETNFDDDDLLDEDPASPTPIPTLPTQQPQPPPSQLLEPHTKFEINMVRIRELATPPPKCRCTQLTSQGFSPPV
ncbi:hypothetical protein KI387_007693, partial [Taxus chinensis]